MTKLEELTRGLITLVTPTLKRVFEESNLSIQEETRIIKALQAIEDIKKLLNNNKPPEKWSQLPLPLK